VVEGRGKAGQTYGLGMKNEDICQLGYKSLGNFMLIYTYSIYFSTMIEIIDNLTLLFIKI